MFNCGNFLNVVVLMSGDYAELKLFFFWALTFFSVLLSPIMFQFSLGWPGQLLLQVINMNNQSV